MVSPLRKYLNMHKVFFFGTSGGCLDAFYLYKEIFDAKTEFVFLSDKHSIGEYVSGCPIVGPFNYVTSGAVKGCQFVFQCGSVKNHRKRHVWFRKAIELGMIPTTLISDKAYIHETAFIGRGSIIYPGVKVMRNVTIGENCIILPNAIINHDSLVGDYSIINSSCVLNGKVDLGHNSYIGSSSTIKENIAVPPDTTIGMSSVVLTSPNQKGLYFGAPVRFIRREV